MTVSLTALQHHEREAFFRLCRVHQAVHENPDRPQPLDVPADVAGELALKGLVTWFGEGLATPTEAGLAAYKAWQARAWAMAKVAMQFDQNLTEDQALADVEVVSALFDAWVRNTEFFGASFGGADGTAYRFLTEPADGWGG